MSFAPYHARIIKVLQAQLLVAVLALGIVAVVGNTLDIKSALIGCLIALIPNALFAYRLLRASGNNPQEYATAFYRGEFLKLTTTALLFGLVFKFVVISFLPLLLAFMAVLSVFWFSLLIVK